MLGDAVSIVYDLSSGALGPEPVDSEPADHQLQRLCDTASIMALAVCRSLHRRNGAARLARADCHNIDSHSSESCRNGSTGLVLGVQAQNEMTHTGGGMIVRSAGRRALVGFLGAAARGISVTLVVPR